MHVPPVPQLTTAVPQLAELIESDGQRQARQAAHDPVGELRLPTALEATGSARTDPSAAQLTGHSALP
jgi:hypothetical protein